MKYIKFFLQHGIAAIAFLTKQLIINPTEYMSRSDTSKINNETILNNNSQKINQTCSKIQQSTSSSTKIKNENKLDYFVTEL